MCHVRDVAAARAQCATDGVRQCSLQGMSIVGMLVGAALEHIFRAIIHRPLDPVDPLQVRNAIS